MVKQLAEGHVSRELSDPKFPTAWLCSLLSVLRSLSSRSVGACDPKEPLTIPSTIPHLHLCSVEGSVGGRANQRVTSALGLNGGQSPGKLSVTGRAESLVGRENTGTAQQ